MTHSNPLLPSERLGTLLGITEDGLATMIKREEAAKHMMGGLLGNCYLLTEVVDGLLLEANSTVKQQQWFRQSIKRDFNQVRDQIRKTITHSKRNSPSSQDYMVEIADNMSERLKGDLFALFNVIYIHLGKKHVHGSKVLAELIVIHIMLQWIGKIYDDAVDYMVSEVYGDKEFYDSWYGYAGCKGICNRMESVVKAVAKMEILSDTVINLNDIPQIMHALNAMRWKLKDEDGTIVARSSEACDPGSGPECYSQALETLGIPAV